MLHCVLLSYFLSPLSSLSVFSSSRRERNQYAPSFIFLKNELDLFFMMIFPQILIFVVLMTTTFVSFFVSVFQDKFQDKYPELKQFEQWRSKVGAFGVTGDSQLNPIANLRCAFSFPILHLHLHTPGDTLLRGCDVWCVLAHPPGSHRRMKHARRFALQGEK